MLTRFHKIFNKNYLAFKPISCNLPFLAQIFFSIQVKIWDAAQSLLFSRRRAITNECARLPLSLRQHPGFESRAAARSYRMFSLCEDRTQHSSAPTDVQNTYGARLQYWREQNINIGRTCLAVSRWDCRQLWDILKQEAIAISAKNGLLQNCDRNQVG